VGSRKTGSGGRGTRARQGQYRDRSRKAKQLVQGEQSDLGKGIWVRGAINIFLKNYYMPQQNIYINRL
jgi:hypothetical protein